MITWEDDRIDISRCSELQRVLWGIVPEYRKAMLPEDILLHYETGIRHMSVEDMGSEEKEVFEYVVNTLSGGILLA